MKAIALTMAVFALAAPSAALAECVKYEPAKETVSGSVYSQVYPGPPGYGEDPKHDAKETHYFIKLDKTICVQESRTQPDLDSAESGIATMQILDSAGEPFKSEWVGKHVVITGTLTHQITAHHWTKVLIVAEHTRVSDVRAP